LKKLVEIYPTPNDLAEKLAEELVTMIRDSGKLKKQFTIALSGGSTPGILFSLLGDQYSDSVSWEHVHFFWGDERCVSPDDKESNFGIVRRSFFDKIKIPVSNIHRIKGEANPEEEACAYSDDILNNTVKRDGLPVFDFIILGLGEDGHTASIFPENIGLLNSDKICEVSVHPLTLQKRITITGRVINNAKTVVFLVAGKHKAPIIKDIFKRSASAVSFPAFHIAPVYGVLKWIIDKEAGGLL
jgi:6-phosphogluconolactonase